MSLDTTLNRIRSVMFFSERVIAQLEEVLAVTCALNQGASLGSCQGQPKLPLLRDRRIGSRHVKGDKMLTCLQLASTSNCTGNFERIQVAPHLTGGGGGALHTGID